jgi:hypothetical protein
MASFDPAEQMHACAFDLIASRTTERRLADHIEISVDLGVSHSPYMKAVRGKVMPDPCAIPKHDSRSQQPVFAPSQSCQLISRLITACRLPEHIAIEFQYLIGSQNQLPRDKLV